jgi:hypothetical protein
LKNGVRNPIKSQKESKERMYNSLRSEEKEYARNISKGYFTGLLYGICLL